MGMISKECIYLLDTDFLLLRMWQGSAASDHGTECQLQIRRRQGEHTVLCSADGTSLVLYIYESN